MASAHLSSISAAWGAGRPLHAGAAVQCPAVGATRPGRLAVLAARGQPPRFAAPRGVPSASEDILGPRHLWDLAAKPAKAPPATTQGQGAGASPLPSLPVRGPWAMGGMTAALVGVQAVAFVGAIVGGKLARQRRYEMEEMNAKLRVINAELRRMKDDAEDELRLRERLASREALEASLEAPSAAHPLEAIEGGSNAAATREMIVALTEGRAHLRGGDADMALLRLERAQVLAEELHDKPHLRSALRGQAAAHRQNEDLMSALRCLELLLGVVGPGQDGHLGDVYGEIGDVYADLGNLERAAEYYDMCIDATMTYDDI